jgi:hypothetical protein
VAVTVSKDFSELLASFNAHGVRALVVGGYAFAFHARPRYTKDLDLWIDPSPDNVERLLRALDDFGFGSVGLTAQDFERPGQFVQLGYPPNRIDLMTSIPGLTFEEAWTHRVEDRYGSEPVSFLSKDDLIRNKRAVGRRQDLLDLEILES